jgi:opine dehydrogenase
LVVFVWGKFGGALAFARALREAGRTELAIIMETDGLYYGGFKFGSSGVRLSGLKAGLVAAAFPATDTDEGLDRLNSIFPNYAFGRAQNALETGLRNMNPMLHPPISILNVGRTAPDRSPFPYYKEGVTPV